MKEKEMEEKEPVFGNFVVSIFFLICAILFCSSYMNTINSLQTVKCKLESKKDEDGYSVYSYKFNDKKYECYAKYPKNQKPEKNIEVQISPSAPDVVQNTSIIYTMTILWFFVFFKQFRTAYIATRQWLIEKEQEKGATS